MCHKRKKDLAISERNLLAAFNGIMAAGKCRLLFFIFTCFTIPLYAQRNSQAPGKGNGSLHKDLDTATFAGGCFWCIEAQFKELKGVIKVISGFTGGNVAHPTYEQVCTGTTGHAEAVAIIYDPSGITYDELLAGFFTAHDPTQLNRQGNDEGTQYRSAVFYHNANQKKLATYYISKLNESKAYNKHIVTEVRALGVFYSAEKYHQDYYNKNKGTSYCQYVIQPKLDKFRMVFSSKLKNKTGK
ncbi:MAG: peptide-methionine (S)-S-oxide reductase MsrA [Taibaiella sp.]|jgi:peptide-methionine (S)-S-oxide reductase